MTLHRNFLPYWLSAPATLVVLALVAVPLVMTFSLSFYAVPPGGGIDPSLTLQNYGQIVGDYYYLEIFTRTILLAVLVTAACMLIGIPEAYVLSRLSSGWRAVSLVIVLGPLLVSVVVRTLGWAILLGNEGMINKALLAVGWIDRPIQLMYSYTGLVSRCRTCWCPTWCCRFGRRCKSSIL
jgi:putative spermidine/putrescine transport system permease protein